MSFRHSKSQHASRRVWTTKSPQFGIMDDWILQPSFTESFDGSNRSLGDCEALQAVLRNPHKFLSAQSLGVGPQSCQDKQRLLGLRPLIEKCWETYPHLGLLLAECHFLLNDTQGALTWCRKARTRLSQDEDLETTKPRACYGAYH